MITIMWEREGARERERGRERDRGREREGERERKRAQRFAPTQIRPSQTNKPSIKQSNKPTTLLSGHSLTHSLTH